MIGGMTDVVAVQRYRREPRIRPQKLRARDRRSSERAVRRDLAVIGVGNLLGKLRPEFELLDRKLVQVNIRDAEAGQLRSQVPGLEAPVFPECLLDAQVPLLRVPAAV